MTKVKTKQYDVFFVDDDDGVRELILEELKGINCNASCFGNASDCLEQLAKDNCDLLITDVRMPGMDGMTLLNRVRRTAPWVPVMMITGFGDIPMAIRAIKLGAVDFIEKPLNRRKFLHKVETLLEHGDLFDMPAGRGLTKIEKKVLKMILEGKGNKEMAYILGRALRTVERHRSDIMHKFGVDSVVDLIKKTDLMDLDDVE